MIIQPSELPETTENGYSQARVDDGVFRMSGMTGRVGDYEPAGDDIESQTRQAYENIELILGEIDKDLTDISKVIVKIVDLQHNWENYWEVHRQVFKTEPYPCVTAFGIERLPQEELLVLIDADISS
jgi:2-iminobutanoate/2-iminopropanoate deaminase